MFVGHYAPALAARRSSADLPLWVWFVACQWLDFGFMTLVLLGVEKVRLVPGFTKSNALDLYYMPYTHGLVGATVMSIGFAALVGLAFPRARTLGALTLVALVSFSHWVLDLVMHTPDLPIVSGSPKLGFGLWNHHAAGLALELGLLALGAWFSARTLDSVRARRVWIFVGGMVVLQLYSHFGPTPPSAQQFAVSALVAYVLLTFGAVWLERGKPVS